MITKDFFDKWNGKGIDPLGLIVYNTLMKQIPLTQDKFTLVDDENFEELNKYKWTYMKGYAIRGIGGRKNRRTLYMHREIIKTPEEMFTDHIDRDGLNNQKSNLRIVDKSKNMFNSKISSRNKSGYKGVHKMVHKAKYKDKIYFYPLWRVQITIKGKTIPVGKFKKIEDAIEARRKAEIKYFKEYRYA